MYRKRIKKLEERINALEKAFSVQIAQIKPQGKKDEAVNMSEMSASSELDWDNALKRIEKANRTNESLP